MKVYRGYHERPLAGPAAVAIGNFDGVHLGHQAIVGQSLLEAGRMGGEAVVLTFDPHPLKVLAPDRAPRLITTRDRRRALLAEAGLDTLVEQPFDRAFAALRASEFVSQVLLEGLGAKAILVGQGFRFGHDRSGDIEHLRSWERRGAFRVMEVPVLHLGGKAVSSTRLRELIRSGAVSEAALLLGRPFVVEGQVVQGAKRGRHLGFPTANIRPDTELLPALGVYAARAMVQGQALPAVINVGRLPTFGGRDISFEAHILDFQADLYDQPLAVEIWQRLREERRFPDVQALVRQIHQDILVARQFFASEIDLRAEVMASCRAECLSHREGTTRPEGRRYALAR